MVTDIFTGDFCRGRVRAGRAPRGSTARRYLPAPAHVGSRWGLGVQEKKSVFRCFALRFARRKEVLPATRVGRRRLRTGAREMAPLLLPRPRHVPRTVNKGGISVLPKSQASRSRPKACACSSGTAGGERGRERGRGAGVAPGGHLGCR